MASEPVRSTAVVAAPKDYSVAPAQQIRLLSVAASFDGSGSASTWLPAVEILDNNGNVLVTAADQAVTVAAGASADVSWFPGVRNSSAATPAGAEWCWAGQAAGTTYTPGATFVPWNPATFETSNSSVFSLSNRAGPNTSIRVSQAGIVSTYATATPPGADWSHGIFLGGAVENDMGTGAENFLKDSGGTATPAGNPNNLRDFRVSVPYSVPFDLFLEVANYTAVNHTLAFVEIGLIWQPNAKLFT